MSSRGQDTISQRAEKTTIATKLKALRGVRQQPHKYQVIKDFLEDEFSKGHYEPGDSLPSENTLTQKLGVSRPTVRQAVDELIKEGLVKRVHGKGSYFINPINHKNGERLAAFGLVMPEISHDMYVTLAKGFEHRSRGFHQAVLLCNTDFDINQQASIILQMIEKNVAGVALVSAINPPTPAFHVAQLQRHDIPVVLCHRPVSGVCAPLIRWNPLAVGRMAGQVLQEKGHRRVAYFSHFRYSLHETYETGLRQVLLESGLDLPDDHVHYGMTIDCSDRIELQGHIAAIKTMLNGSDPITAIFCSGDIFAEYLLTELMQSGIRIPEDLSILAFGDSHSRNGALRGQIVSVTVDEYELGKRAAQVLYEMRIGQRPIDSEEVIYKPLSVSDGDTLAAI